MQLLLDGAMYCGRTAYQFSALIAEAAARIAAALAVEINW